MMYSKYFHRVQNKLYCFSFTLNNFKGAERPRQGRRASRKYRNGGSGGSGGKCPTLFKERTNLPLHFSPFFCQKSASNWMKIFACGRQFQFDINLLDITWLQTLYDCIARITIRVTKLYEVFPNFLGLHPLDHACTKFRSPSSFLG